MADDRWKILRPHRRARLHETQVADAPLDLYLFPKALLEKNTNPDAARALLSLDIATFSSRRFRVGGVIQLSTDFTTPILKPEPRITRRSIRVIVEIYFYTILVFPKIKYVPKIMKIIHVDVFPRRRASPRAARAPVRCGVDRASRWAWFPTV